jgi:hypothetical protein
VRAATEASGPSQGTAGRGDAGRRAARRSGALERCDVAAVLCSFGLALFEINFLQIFE